MIQLPATLPKELKPINPTDQMPAPKEFFFLVSVSAMNSNIVNPLIPAMHPNHVPPDKFYSDCILFSSYYGSSYKIEDQHTQYYIGWVPMFTNTQTYIIQKGTV